MVPLEVRASQRASPAGGPALALRLPARRLRGLQALAAAHAGGDLRGAAAKRLLPLRRLGRVRGGHGAPRTAEDNNDAARRARLGGSAFFGRQPVFGWFAVYAEFRATRAAGEVCPGRRLGRGRRRPQRRKAPGAGAELRPGAAAQPARLPRRRAGLGAALREVSWGARGPKAAPRTTQTQKGRSSFNWAGIEINGACAPED